MALWQYVARRLVLLVPVLVGISIITFGLAFFSSHGHLEFQYLKQSDRVSEEQVQRIIQLHGFDKPAYVQYFLYLRDVFHGDLGISTSVNDPVAKVIQEKFPASVELAVVAMTFAVLIGIPWGIVSATRRDRPADHVTRLVALSGVSVPVFWLGLILQLLLSYWLGQQGFTYFPLFGRYDSILSTTHPSLVNGPTHFLLLDTLLARDFVAFGDVVRHLILPGFTLGFVTLAIITRMMRASMLEVLGLDYVRTARAKGLEESVVINRHARRNALIPTTTVIGLSLGGLMGGAVLTETIFQWPGLGNWAAHATLSVDTAAIMGFVALTALIYVLANLIVDVIYAYLDPRVRLD
jgi:peptide/nickel transport system permease protein